jgi:hypothetical protein
VGVEVIGMGKGHLFYARHRLDLSSGDSLFGVGSCCRPWRRDRLEAEVLGSCSSGDGGLVCYSVRSGWDLWLGARGLRGGDEVLVSAVTHPDMVRISIRTRSRLIPRRSRPPSRRARGSCWWRTSLAGAWTLVPSPGLRGSTA